MKAIKIIIADDHQMFIDGLKALLQNDDRFHVIGEVTNGVDLLQLLAVTEVEVILMDINMPHMNGVEATREINRRFPSVKIIILTLYNKRQFIEQTLAAGALGYILKNCSKHDLIEALVAVNLNRPFYSKGVTEIVMDSLKSTNISKKDSLANLSNREIEILKLIVQEYSTKEISKSLFISENTVDTHRKNLLSKINAKNIAGLVRFAIENNIVNFNNNDF